MSDSRPWWHNLSVVLLLWALFAQLALSARHKSATMDEQLHILNGVTWFLSDHQRIIVGNPPFVNILEAAPLIVLDDVSLPTDSPLWPGTRWQEISQQFLWQTNGDHTCRLIFMVRLVVMGLTLLLAVGVYRWARELCGPAAGLLALLLFIFDPNVLAHGRLATTDLGAACFTLWAAYLFWRYHARPGWRRFVLAGLALGAALTTKFSAVLLVPAFLVLGLWPAEPMRRQSWVRSALRGAIASSSIFGIAFLILLATYRFNVVTLLAEYDWQRMHFERGHHAFLMGQYSITGWWYYFPVAFVLKTPIPLMTLAAIGLISLRRRKRDLAFLSLSPLIIFAASLFSRVNIGYRYLLPVLPFLSVLASSASSITCHLSPGVHRRAQYVTRNTRYVICAVLIGWVVFGTFRTYPHYLAYFNELAGGPEEGWRYLVDSNLDWGQDLPGLRAYMEAQDLDKVYLSWFGDAPPEQYGINYDPLPSWPLFAEEPWHRVYHPKHPLPGIYAISATHLQGVYLPDRDTYAWFRERAPVTTIGYSIFVYNVSHIGGEAVSVCLSGISIDQVDTETFGTNDLSLRWFDARGALVLPAGGRDAWYLLADATPLDSILRQRFLASNQVWGRRQTLGDEQTYTLYHLTADDVAKLAVPAPNDGMPVWWSLAVTFPPGYERHSLSLPANFDHHLAFLGYELAADHFGPGDELQLLTFWRVEQPFEPPLALFVHLLDAEGQVRSQHDGLSVDPMGIKVGDVFVHIHRFPVPSDAPPGEYQLELGVYRPDTWQRWAIHEGEDAVVDRLLLRPVSMEAK